MDDSRLFFTSLAAKSGFPQGIIDELMDTYKTKAALYADIDAGGPADDCGLNLSPERIGTLRITAIKMREEMGREVGKCLLF